MNIDSIFLRFRPDPDIYGTCPKDFMTKEFTYSTDKLLVLLPGWCVTTQEDDVLRNKIVKEGYSFLSYEFASEILSSDFKATKRYFDVINRTVREDIKLLKRKYGFREIQLVGVSLGTLVACMVANDNKLITKLLLVVPGNCLAESLWYGLDTISLRDAYESKGVTLPMLKRYWSSLAPENNIDKLKAEKIQVVLSKSDVIIPYQCGRRLYDSLIRRRYEVTCKENAFLGHFLTVYLFYFRPKKYLIGS